MLMAHPAVLKDLIAQYEALTLLRAEESTAQARQRLADVSYTLCVATGTRDVDMALIAARHRLSGARPEDDSLLQPSVLQAPAPQASTLRAPVPAEPTPAV
ncbi:DUF5133 domain-containing protein [Streptomyces echinatus]|uniref:DUF5133 domain-containing protein n=1 Tax=Streptomyces echinatus TaxID=67293 RepID=A0A7W9Q1K3_9ACTN|nr:DUF5133 domain-containing protein [Streptomyces echinatus]MBB5931012.1 hypothetical protein [Streptomyces echinatus]